MYSVNRHILIVFFLFFFFFGITSGQQSAVDSLRAQVVSAKTDSARLDQRIFYAIALSKIDLNKGLIEIQDVREQAGEKKLHDIEVSAVLNMGNIYFDYADYVKAILTYEEAQRLYAVSTNRELRDWGVAATAVNIAATYTLMNDWEPAQRYYDQAIVQFEKLKDTRSLKITIFNKAFIFIDMQQWDKAYQYLKEAALLKINDQNQDASLQCAARLAAICCKRNMLNEAKYWLKVADTLYNKPVYDLGKSYYYDAWGEYDFHLQQFENSLASYRESYRYALLWKDPYFIADEAMNIGRVYLQLNNIDSARSYLAEAFEMARAHKFLPKIRIMLNDWCNYYLKNKQYDKAYEYRTWLNNLNDSLITTQNHNRILLYDAKYQSEKKEQHIKQLEQEKKIQQLSLRQQSVFNYVLMGSLAALLIIAFLSYRYFHVKHQISQQTGQLQAQRIRELEQEKQLIAFDFLLKGQEEERSRMAKDLHDGLGGMLSGVKLSLSAMKGNVILTEENARLFAKALSQLDNSMNEMRRVAHNMMPEALVKFGLQQAIQDYCDSLQDSSEFKISGHFHGLEKRIDPTTEIIVYRIVQELLNNVVKHAQATEVLVQVMRHNNDLNITVEDNGKGFDIAGLENSKGAGLYNVRSRVDYLKGQLDIRTGPGKGTSVHIDCNLTEE